MGNRYPTRETLFLSVRYSIRYSLLAEASHCTGDGSRHWGLFAGQANIMSQHRLLLIGQSWLGMSAARATLLNLVIQEKAQLSLLLCLHHFPGPYHYWAGGETHRNGQRRFSHPAALHTSTRVLSTSAHVHQSSSN